MRAVVSFRDYGQHPLNFLLKKGFRHVVVAVLTPHGWVEIDYSVGVPVVKVFDPTINLEAYYEQLGYICVTTKQNVNKEFKFNLFYGNILIANCVGLVKAILGIDSFAITPYQLYKRLNK